jgi:hypothetical protein
MEPLRRRQRPSEIVFDPRRAAEFRLVFPHAPHYRRGVFRGRVELVALVLLGCAPPVSRSLPPVPSEVASPTPSASASPTPVSPEPEVTSSEEHIDIAETAPVSLEQAPHVELMFPLAGKRIATEKAAAYAIKVKTSNWSDELRLMLMLDDFTPLVLQAPEDAVTLGRLVPEDRELSPGIHRLFVTAVHPTKGSVRLEKPRSRAPFSAIEFWVGDAEASPAPNTTGPRLVHLAPSGTYNGSRGENVLVDFQVLGLDTARREVEVEVARTSPGNKAFGRLRLPHDALATIESLESGDYDVTVRLLDPEGAAVPFAEGVKSRTITVNRDAPESR